MNEIHITTVDWVNGKALRDIRQQVFIDEQQVPADLEWDLSILHICRCRRNKLCRYASQTEQQKNN